MTKSSAGQPVTEMLQWRKSTYSNPNGECIEVAELADGQVVMRNSRTPSEGTLVFTRGEILAFLRGAKDGEFDDLT
jgi:hypothetical protein